MPHSRQTRKRHGQSGKRVCWQLTSICPTAACGCTLRRVRDLLLGHRKLAVGRAVSIFSTIWHFASFHSSRCRIWGVLLGCLLLQNYSGQLVHAGTGPADVLICHPCMQLLAVHTRMLVAAQHACDDVVGFQRVQNGVVSPLLKVARPNCFSGVVIKEAELVRHLLNDNRLVHIVQWT